MAYKHILLIDDDEEDHEIFKTALNLLPDDFLCTTFTNARKALDKLLAGELKPDVIFLDLNMPIMSGQEFLVEVKKRKDIQHIPVIIFSTSSQQSTIKSTKDLGALDFITKPDRFDKLVDLLKPILN
jgi:DNA-binding NtrC family response regulator